MKNRKLGWLRLGVQEGVINLNIEGSQHSRNMNEIRECCGKVNIGFDHFCLRLIFMSSIPPNKHAT
jgi:hypothetical protein